MNNIYSISFVSSHEAFVEIRKHINDMGIPIQSSVVKVTADSKGVDREDCVTVVEDYKYKDREELWEDDKCPCGCGGHAYYSWKDEK